MGDKCLYRVCDCVDIEDNSDFVVHYAEKSYLHYGYKPDDTGRIDDTHDFTNAVYALTFCDFPEIELEFDISGNPKSIIIKDQTGEYVVTEKTYKGFHHYCEIEDVNKNEITFSDLEHDLALTEFLDFCKDNGLSIGANDYVFRHKKTLNRHH